MQNEKVSFLPYGTRSPAGGWWSTAKRLRSNKLLHKTLVRLIPNQQAPLDIPPYPVVSKPEILIGGQHDGQQLSDRINWHGRPDGLSAGSVCPTVELTEEDLADFSTFIQQAFELGLHEPSCKLQNTMIGALLEKNCTESRGTVPP